jgi:gliding motility-associated lipoprotein GldH
MFKYILLACTFGFLFVSCGPDDYFHASKDLPKEGWMYRDTVNFTFNIDDTSALYNIFVDMKYLDTFPNQNVYLKLYTRFPNGRRMSKPYSFDLFNAQGVSKASLQENAYFDQKGTYVLTVEQFMRRDSIPAITSVGLRLQKTKQKH